MSDFFNACYWNRRLDHSPLCVTDRVQPDQLSAQMSASPPSIFLKITIYQYTMWSVRFPFQRPTDSKLIEYNIEIKQLLHVSPQNMLSSMLPKNAVVGGHPRLQANRKYHAAINLPIRIADKITLYTFQTGISCSMLRNTISEATHANHRNSNLS